MSGVTTNVFSRKMSENQKDGSSNFENKGSGVVYLWGEENNITK